MHPCGLSTNCYSTVSSKSFLQQKSVLDAFTYENEFNTLKFLFYFKNTISKMTTKTIHKSDITILKSDLVLDNEFLRQEFDQNGNLKKLDNLETG